MRLAIDPLAQPIGDGDWRSYSSVAQANPYVGFSRKAYESIFLRTWKWARAASVAANALADKLSNDAQRGDNANLNARACAAEALRIAKRHDGVWRAANKLTRVDRDGKEIRAIVAVRSDAGDSTCPTFLERQGKKRASEMMPIVAACNKLGYIIASARSPAIPRDKIKQALSFFGDPAWRKLHGILGVDILIVPTVDNLVVAHVLCCFAGSCHNITLPVTLDFHPIIDIERLYDEPACAAYALGPALWIESQVARFRDGKRCRDRLTYGCFYGKLCEEFIVAAATLERKDISTTAIAALHEVEARIQQSIELTKRCLDVGDLEAARAAYSYIGAYIYDAHLDLAAYPLVVSALRYTSFVDFSGCSDAPALPSLHDELMVEVRSLPHPKPLAAPAWRCIELVPVHSVADIMSLIDWARGE